MLKVMLLLKLHLLHIGYFMSKLPSKIIAISNVLVRSGQSLTLAEKRILFAGLAQLGGKNEFVTLRADEFAEVFDVSVSVAYRQLKSAVHSIFQRYVSYPVFYKNYTGKRHSAWISSYEYYDDLGYVNFKFNDDIFPYLFEFQNHFTKYQLKQACALRSIHSWRLLELLEQQKETDKDGMRWLKIPIEEFHHAMESSQSYKKTFGLLNKKVIQPALKELREKDNWLIEFTPHKKGRKFALLEFKFKKNLQNNLFD